MSAEDKLCNARDRLKELGQAIDSLETSYPDIFEPPEVRARLEAFRQAHREATSRLDAPSLCITTLGTTASGKLTIVNALIGRSVVPMMWQEMSGGVLRLRHSDEHKLIVEATEGAVWETGEWTGLSDEALYERIFSGVMLPYHAHRRKKDCIAPQVTAFCPLLPASDLNLLGLPAGVGVEFIELPGLKSVQDRANLIVIQEQILKAFTIFALGYSVVDDEHRKNLLKELKQVVEYLRVRTDSMIFILNKVDLRGSIDLLLSERISRLQKEIQEVLSLREPPEVLPFTAQILYYAQCAWGSSPLNGSSSVAQSTRLELLDAMLKDCAKVIEQQAEKERSLRRWFFDLEERVLDGKHIDDETMRQILEFALEWSGGKQLWQRLRTRVQESFSELVILPALVEVFDEYDALAKAIGTLAEVRKIESKGKVDAALVKINHTRQRLEGKIQNKDEVFPSYLVTKSTELVSYRSNPTMEQVMSAEDKLRGARDRLKELGQAIDSLETSYPDIFEPPQVRAPLEAFRQAHGEATSRLESPNLRIANLGTTSSGKSTIVNALIGRSVAPMESEEASGGVLKLRHSDEHKLIVEATEGAAWEPGEWTGLSDEALYERIFSGVMLPYHAHRRKKDCIAPQVTAFCPLLPASDLNLLGLPTGVGVEFIDLPGLKSVQDRANLTVIQEQVIKAFSIVALDYGQVDDESRKKLLEELKRVVEYLRGSPDSMLFILNKVDLHGSKDLPLSERISKLQTEIQEVLSLREPPEVLPFTAQILYYAQCAWGSVALNGSSPVAQPTRLKLLDAMLKDCPKVIKQQTDEDRSLRRWFFDLEERVLDGKHIDDETMRQILEYALEWSGGKQLWQRLRTRVQESFAELVILPALVEVFEKYDVLAKAIETRAEIRKLDSKEKVEAALTQINATQQRLEGGIQNISDKFLNYVTLNIDGLKKNDPVILSRLAEEARKRGYKGFQSLFEAVDRVRTDIFDNLINPVRQALKNNQEVYDLEEKLGEIISPVLAKDIARAYDSVAKRLNNFERRSGYLVKSVREDDERANRELTAAEFAVRKLYQAMREALQSRSEFMLQTQAQNFEQGLKDLVKDQVNQLCKLCKDELPLLKLDEAINTAFQQNISRNLPSLPQKFFEITADIEESDDIHKEKIGTQQKTKYREVGSCFKRTESYTVEEAKYFEAELERWSDISAHKDSATIVRQELEDISLTSPGGGQNNDVQ